MSIEITYTIPPEKMQRVIELWAASQKLMNPGAIIEYALDIGLTQLSNEWPVGIARSQPKNKMPRETILSDRARQDGEAE